MKSIQTEIADVVVVGFGGAGASAALVAAAGGADVLILEKNPEGGGNTRYSGGTMRTYVEVDKATDYIEALCEGTTDRDVVATFVRESNQNADWVASIGGEVGPTFNQVGKRVHRYPRSLPLAAFPSIPGGEGMGPRVRVKGVGDAGGIDLWAVLSRKVQSTNIRTKFSMPARKLLFDKNEGVTGVVAKGLDAEINIQARRAVILTCGGFEYDQNMHTNYLGQRYFGLCNPANTGDGIRLAAEIGADLWHMNGVAATLGYKFPEFVFGIRQSIPSAGFVYVDQTGKRFMDEPGTDAHLMWAPISEINTKTLQRIRVPSYVVFDEDTRTRGPIGATGHGKVSDTYQWSPDNSVELRKGWIKAADTLPGLAKQIGIAEDALQATVSRYNMQCVGGYDPDFGREAETLVPLGRPPYYAIETWPCLFNTQGGPKRNARAQVLDVWGRPIKRLYSAGELGSLWHRNYPGAGNVSEALAFGRIAGRNAALEEPIKT